MPTNFYVIIFIQALVYIHSAWKNNHLFLNKKDLLASFLFGLIFGFLLDIFAASLHMYTYVRDSILSHPRPWNLTLSELIINALISYGIATATVKTILTKTNTIESKRRFRPALLFIVLTLCSTYTLFHIVHGTILTMFMVGLWIISLGELLLLKKNIMGPVTELIFLKNISTSVQFWWKITFIAILYEFANILFPFWAWLPGSIVPQSAVEVLVILGGYYVLFHPMIVFWRLYEHRALANKTKETNA